MSRQRTPSIRLAGAARAIAHRVRRAVLDTISNRTRSQAGSVRMEAFARQTVSPGRHLLAIGLSRLADVASMSELHARAAALLARSVDHDPTDARAWEKLGDALAACGPLQPTHVTVLGVSERPGGDLPGALAAYARAEQLCPAPAVAAAISRTLARSNELPAAVSVAQAAALRFPSHAAPIEALAHSTAEIGRQNGGLLPSQVEQLTQLWRRLHEHPEPVRSRAAFHLLRHAIRFRDWATAYESTGVDDDNNPSVESVRRAVGDPGLERPPAWWFVASWQLRAEGFVTEAHHARRRAALIEVDRPVAPIPTIESVRARVRALVLLGRPSEAATIVSQAQRLPDPSGRLRRLEADIALRLGNVEPIAVLAATHRTGLPREPEDSFEKLVAGRRVGVVGPNARAEQRLALARRSDVLVETKCLADPQLGADCSLISYYADTSVALFHETIRTLIDEGKLDLAVIRPTNVRSLSSCSAWHAGLRIMPTEDSVSSGGSHFGIARIVYDVLRVRPSSLELVGVDMFTGSTTYPSSYRADDSAYSEAGFARVLNGFDHDFADDHMMLSTLFGAGAIDADAATAAVLNLGLDEYLARLDGRRTA